MLNIKGGKNMRKYLLKKESVFGIIVLLIGAGVFPVAGTINDNENVIENQIQVESEKQNNAAFKDVDWWPMFHHDLNNSGFSTSKYAPQTSNILWTFETGLFVMSSPAVVNSKVYVGSFDEYFYCLDIDTGALIWKNFIPGGTCAGSACVVGGRVYVGTGYDHVFCWDADTGAEIWRFYKGYGLPLSPAVSDGKVYMPYVIDNFKPRISCLDADTGTEIWNRNFADGEISHVALCEGKVYVSHYYGLLYCLDSETGETVWEKTTGGRHGAPAIAKGRVYASADGIRCYDADTGEEIWHYKGQWSYCAPAVAYDRVYYTSSAGKILCLDADTGDNLWVYDIGSGYEHAIPTPAIADDKMYSVLIAPCILVIFSPLPVISTYSFICK